MKKLWDWVRQYLAPGTPFKLTALILLLVMVILGAAPGYFQGNWRWSWVGPITNLSELRNVRKAGLDVPNWETLRTDERLIGSKKWSAQQLRPQAIASATNSPAPKDTDSEDTAEAPAAQPPATQSKETEEQSAAPEANTYPKNARPNAKGESGNDEIVQLMLLPIRANTDQPQVEWSDWEGVARINTDSERFVDLQAKVGRERATFTVRLLRGWTENNTTLVMAQWYAWPGGGSPRPSDWFWADRGSQIRRFRLPWIAVNIAMETKRPLDELEDYQEFLENVAIDVQQALIAGPLQSKQEKG